MMKVRFFLGSWMLCACAFAAPDFSSGLVGHWSFEGCDGKLVKDRSAGGNNGVIVSGALHKERATTSLELDGLGGHVLLPPKAGAGFSNALTAALWVRAAELRNNTVLFGVPYTNANWTTPMFGMYLSGKRVIYGLWGARGGVKSLVESPGELPLDTWTWLVGTFDGTTARLYLNGALCAEQPRTGAIVNNGQPLIIGKGLGHLKPSLSGRVGELRLYSRCLSPDEIHALYAHTSVAFDLAAPLAKKFKDGTVIVETHGSSPASEAPWRKNPTRLLEQLTGYTPRGDSVQVDRFGGWVDRPQEKATGFFRVQKIAGRQWLIDPEGQRYFNIGMNTVQEPRGVEKLFGSGEKWAETVTGQLRDAGFNGLGNGGASRLNKVAQPLVWVLRKNFMFTFAKELGLTEPASGTVGFLNKCMPVFHPDFEAFCDRFGRDLADTASDPLLLGIMTDNELQCPVDLLDRHLALDPANPKLKPGREAAAAWLAARQGGRSPAEITQRDRYAFIAFAFDQYYRIVAKTVRKYDPHHLYLGSRINYHQGEFDNPFFWKMLAPYHDVVSVNYYNQWGPDARQLAQWDAWAGRPILLTEWYAKAMDVPGLANLHGAGWLVHTQEDRARYYQHFALAALETKNIVGWHWFKYRDDPKESVALDAAGGANKGLFDFDGRAYDVLYQRARAVNREAYPLIQFFDARNRE